LVHVQEPVERVAERVDLVALEGGVLVLAVTETGGRIATTSWKPETPFGPEEVRAAGDRLKRALPIRGAREALAHAARARQEGTQVGAPLASAAFARTAQLLQAASDPAVRFDGADHIAAQPEFQSAARLRPLLSLLAEREPLARALEAVAESGRPRVSIGRENGTGPMKECSIVAMRVDAHGLRGVLGVMGPLRMPYRKVVSIVSYVGEQLAAG
jgi:heat-inducible transcriptional repressor